MPLVLDGTNGVSGVDGTASNPSLEGTDSNTGIFFPAADTVAIGTGGTEALRVNSSQNVGIGTSSPVVASGYTILTLNNATNGSGAYYQKAGTTLGRCIGESGNFTVGAINSGGNLIFETSGTTERARIDSSGRLLVGTTSATIGAVTCAVALDATTVNSGFGMGINGNASNTQVMRFAYAGTAVGSIVVGTSTTSYNTSSDYRLKENIQPMTGALEKIAALKPCTYTWKSSGEASQGFLAHELQAVVPECVTGEKDAVETYIDEEGNEQTRPSYQGVDTSFLVATLTAAIQEQQAMIDEMKAEIAALKGNA